MENVKLMGIVNRQNGVVDLFDEIESTSSVTLPTELVVSFDPDSINEWALQNGLIQQGQCIAIPAI